MIIAAATMFLLNKRVARVDLKETYSASELFNQAIGLEAQGEWLAAKKDLQKLIEEFPNFRQILDAQRKLEDLNIKIIFSSLQNSQTTLYEVKPGDSLNKISKAFNTTVELIKKSNNLASERIIPGQKLRIWEGKFSIFVDKSQNILVLKSADEIIKTYRVATGNNNSTPVGTFKITSKLINPTWFKAGAVIAPESPENVLGSRWMGFDLPSYGIHGTIEPESIGKQITEGCVRMTNRDVEELFALVPMGTEVTIVD